MIDWLIDFRQVHLDLSAQHVDNKSAKLDKIPKSRHYTYSSVLLCGKMTVADWRNEENAASYCDNAQ